MRYLSRHLAGLLALCFLLAPAANFAAEVAFQDAAGRSHTFHEPPRRVVSIVPAVTEILCRIGASEAIRGVTYHDTYPPEAATKPVVGGFFSPSPERIGALNPEVIFVADRHGAIVESRCGENGPKCVQPSLETLDDLYDTIGLLGRIFDRSDAAARLVRSIKEELAHTAEKLAAVPASGRKRGMRLMGRDEVMTPGDDSFQNAIIRLAGGIPPAPGKPGPVVPVTLDEWRSFNPEVIYGCGDDRLTAETLLNRPGWQDVDAVKNGRIFYFPCELTCRLSSRTGAFVSSLAARIYGDVFAAQPPVRPDGITANRPLALDLDDVAGAEIVETSAYDYIHKTLLIHFASPMAVASTLEGFREGIRHAGNSYSPPQVWGLYHRIGLEESRKRLLETIGRDRGDTSLLFTGADMDNLSVQRRQFKEMIVYALVTAGVRSNALRMGADAGDYYEPGTVNMILLTNMKLSPRAMNRAIISATEAKTAALWDMDIRSAYTPATNPATGTGTDNIIVAEGGGVAIDNAGGHTKMGELIAKAVYAGVQEAVFKQNGIVPNRTVFQRLKERRISLFGLVGDCACGMDAGELTRRLEGLLLEPEYAGFVEAALTLSDHHERGLAADIGGFEFWCERISEKIAGKPVQERAALTFARPLPPVLTRAFEALLNGISQSAAREGG